MGWDFIINNKSFVIIWKLAGGIEKDVLQKPQTERSTVSEDREMGSEGQRSYMSVTTLIHEMVNTQFMLPYSDCQACWNTQQLSKPSDIG